MVESKGNSGLLTTLEANWQAEMEDRATYQSFAARELNARRRNTTQSCGPIEFVLLGVPSPFMAGKLPVELSLSWAREQGLILPCDGLRSMQDTTS